jgi:hypothetical protein
MISNIELLLPDVEAQKIGESPSCDCFAQEQADSTISAVFALSFVAAIGELADSTQLSKLIRSASDC